MQPSIDHLLVRQVSALVSAAADAACTEGENVSSMEAQFYEILAEYCAEKQRLAAAAAYAEGEAIMAQKGLSYW
jgi:hypothetical protein